MYSARPTAVQIPPLPHVAELSMLYRDAGDRGKHKNVIERLAVELGRTVHDVAPLYEEVLASLQHQAQIQDYLPILVSKRVRQLLKR